MKNPITKMRHRAAVLFTFLLIFNSHLKAQYFPDEEIFDTTGIIQETLTDGMDTVWYWGLDEEELETGENYRTSSGMKKNTSVIIIANTRKCMETQLFMLI